RGRASEHGRQDLERLLALAELRRDIRGTDERIEVAGVGIGESAQGIEQLRRRAGFLLERDELAEPGLAFAAELERATQAGDRRTAIASVIAVERREAVVVQRGHRRRWLVLVECGGQRLCELV